MSEKLFEQSMKPREHIDSELADSGIETPEEWRKAFNFDERPEFSNLKLVEAFLKIDKGKKEADIVSSGREFERIKDIEDSGEKLGAFGNMNMSQAIEFIRSHGTDGAFRYLNNRLIFYKKLINGEEIDIKEKDVDWDDNKKEFIIKTISRREKKMDVADPKTIEVGLWRDMYYAVMQGTPEMAAVKIATRRVNEQGIKTKKNIEGRIVKSGISTYDKEFIKLQHQVNGSSPRSVVQFKGYDSGVRQGEIGVYGDLIALYKECEKEVESKVKSKSVDKWQTEHQIVLLMAQRLEGAFHYNGVINTSSSPYNAGITEAVTAGRLGERVMHQMAGMRKKIQSTNFENIKRFIGKSGDNRYENEKKRLDKVITFLSDPDLYPSNKPFIYGDSEYNVSAFDGWKKAINDILFGENENAREKQSEWFARESDRLNHKFERSKVEVEKANLPEEEKVLQLQSVLSHHEDAMSKLKADYENEVGRLKIRTLEQLLADLKQRQKIVDERYEKRKSLAQKALDLHFAFNHTPDEESRTNKPLAGVVDWINYASFGVIKHCHKMRRQGIKEEAIIEYALADTVTGSRGFTREDLKTVHDLTEKAKGQDYEVKRKIKGMMKIGSVISRFGYELPINEIAYLAGKDFAGIDEALKFYNLEQVKKFMDDGVNLESIATVRRITQKSGHDLTPETIAEICTHNIKGFGSAMSMFGLDDVIFLLKWNTELPNAVHVKNVTDKKGYSLSIDSIAGLAGNLGWDQGNSVEEFSAAVEALPMAQVEVLVMNGISYNNKFLKVKKSLEAYGYDFDTLLEYTKAFYSMSESISDDVLERVLKFFSLEELRAVVAENLSLVDVYQVYDALSSLPDYGVFGKDEEDFARNIILTKDVIARKVSTANLLEVRQAIESKGVHSTIEEVISFTQYAGDWSRGQNVTQSIDAFGIDNVRKIVAKNCRLDKALEVNGYMKNNNRNLDRLSAKTIVEILTKGGIDAIIAIAKWNGVEVALKTIEAGFTIEEIIRFPFLISPLVTKK
jgi:hypothetical protein